MFQFKAVLKSGGFFILSCGACIIGVCVIGVTVIIVAVPRTSSTENATIEPDFKSSISTEISVFTTQIKDNTRTHPEITTSIATEPSVSTTQMEYNTRTDPEITTSIVTEESVFKTQTEDNTRADPEIKTSITTEASVSTTQMTYNTRTDPEIITYIVTEESVFTTQTEDNTRADPEIKTSITTEASVSTTQIEYTTRIDPEITTSIVTEESVFTTQTEDNTRTDPEIKTSITSEASVSTTPMEDNTRTDPAITTSIATESSVFTTQREENTRTDPEIKTSITREASVFTTQTEDYTRTDSENKTSLTTESSVFTTQMEDNTRIDPEITTSIATEAPGVCEINQIQYKNTVPILLYPNTNNVIYPQGKATTAFVNKEEVEFSCPQAEVRANGVNLGSSITVVCKSNETFIYNGTNIEWRNVLCSKSLVPTINEVPVQNLSSDDPNKSCDIGGDSTIFLNLGYTVDSNRFINIVNICFNTTNKIALYSHYTLISSINFGSRNVTRSNIRQADWLYKLGYSVKTVYDDSKKTINNLLGLPDDSDKYINNNKFITTQQLASENDFYLATFQLAVKNYANIAPQWNSINKGNWLQENEIRLYASNNNVNLQIWSGTYGVMKLNNETSEPTELYLLEKVVKKEFVIAFPVPELYWKIVYNPLNAQGIVFIGHNNPYVDKVNPEEQICVDISSKISWIRWDKELYAKGYFYACDYNDDGFHSIVDFAPKLKITGHL
ncbi:uncharacterized protein LOC114334473 isoform X12 [Diabrotica virgifera virgifera]|uniref:DNA/RNA non-specific endonuclease/pyrophosphatase/phosphodiesterase domain-containing protein n=1 Tax=Diabrotica virgifera virgifera TaxID=50390 RepID=A0ABM5KVZ2_DIAVI|nr:uncharacterized protein LOC114334473 isoform X12 [Diabrotica virgifera virgifera]